MKMQKSVKATQKGFTLIELMVVVAITGVLAAIAIPAYQDYSVRAKVTEGISASSAAKTAIAEFYADNNAMPANNLSAGLDAAADYATDLIETMTVTSGIVVIDFIDTLGSNVDGTHDELALSAVSLSNGGVKWVCKAGTAPLAAKYLPSSCR